QKIQQLVDRFDALMAEQRWQAADDEITPELQRLAFGSPVESSVINGGRLLRHHIATEITRREREKGFLQTLYQTEIAQTPLSDEPPITYPSADRWEALTLSRKQYAAVSLGGQKPAEARLFEELSRVTTLEFVETPLKDVITMLRDAHNVP